MIPAFKQQKLAQGLELAINALNNQLTSQHQYPTNPSESESASSSDHYYFAIFWVFAVMFFPFWFFHQGSNFCRACKSGVCISAIYLLDLFLFSDKIFSIAVFSGNDSNLLIVFYVQIMPDDFVMQLHRF